MSRALSRRLLPSTITSDEVSIVSDTSSLGKRLQLPLAFRTRQSPRSKPKSGSSSVGSTAGLAHASNARNREEAKIIKLVLDAKRIQQRSCLSETYDAKIAQSMTVTLPAGYRGPKSSSRKISHVSTSNDDEDDMAVYRKSLFNRRSHTFRNPSSSIPIFRGKSRNCSPAVGSLSKDPIAQLHVHSLASDAVRLRISNSYCCNIMKL